MEANRQDTWKLMLKIKNDLYQKQLQNQWEALKKEQNKNNDCKYYENSTMFLIRSFFSKIFAR
jgi:hypothetical protein